jgi:DNA gyrase subunit B
MACAGRESAGAARVAEEGGYHFERRWRGVTDHHIIERSFLISAEARKLHRWRWNRPKLC